MALQREWYEAKNLHDWLTLKGIPHTHVSNEHGGNAVRASLAKKMGVSAGFPDFLIFLPNQVNVALELKIKGNKTSPLQDKWLEILRYQGFEVAVCYGFYEAQDYIKRLLNKPEGP